MARPFGFDISTDLSARMMTWADQFISETSYRRFERACAFVSDETAKRLAQRMNAVTVEVFDRPTPWMRRAWQYRRGLRAGARPGEVGAETFVLDDQSIVMKFAVGDGPNVRRPGDVGLARDRIYVPHWANLALTQRIRPTAQGNLPGGVMARLQREAAGTRAKRRVAGRWGVYKGEVDVGGSWVMGYIAHPPRGEAPLGKNGRSIVVNMGRPRALLVSIDRATYQPVMQAPYDRAVTEAVNLIPGLMEAELADAIAHMASRARR